jgi:hypothetical protein
VTGVESQTCKIYENLTVDTIVSKGYYKPPYNDRLLTAILEGKGCFVLSYVKDIRSVSKKRPNVSDSAPTNIVIALPLLSAPSVRF